MGQEQGPPRIPCVFCGHGNPPGHRFCGMCGKALPDLVKQAKTPQSASGSAGSGGMAAAGRPVAQPVSTASPRAPQAGPPPGPPPVRPTPAPRRENANRDLSYLLHDDDHVPVRPSRVPFVVGGLVLAVVAGFFIMRGSGKKTPAPATGTGDTTESQSAPSAAPDAAPPGAKVEPPKAEEPKAEPPKTESPKTEPPKTESPKTEPAAAEATKAEAPDENSKAESEETETPPATTPAPSHPSPAIAKTHSKPAPPVARAQRQPSPARQPEPSADDAEDTTASTSASGGDCENQLPSLRKAAARGDAKARANLGLAYYAGRCVSRDLPTAYRWYALALRTQPDSPQVSAQLEAIWRQMSPAEKQLALKAQ